MSVTRCSGIMCLNAHDMFLYPSGHRKGDFRGAVCVVRTHSEFRLWTSTCLGKRGEYCSSVLSSQRHTQCSAGPISPAAQYCGNELRLEAEEKEADGRNRRFQQKVPTPTDGGGMLVNSPEANGEWE